MNDYITDFLEKLNKLTFTDGYLSRNEIETLEGYKIRIELNIDTYLHTKSNAMVRIVVNEGKSRVIECSSDSIKTANQMCVWFAKACNKAQDYNYEHSERKRTQIKERFNKLTK